LAAAASKQKESSSSSSSTAAAAAGSAAAVLEWFGGSSARGGARVGGERERGERQRGERASGERERGERETGERESAQRARAERASEERETAERVGGGRERAAAEDAEGHVGEALIEQAEIACSAPEIATCELSLLYQPESACPERGAALRKMLMAEDAQGQVEEAKKKDSTHPDYTTLNEASVTACVARGALAEAERSTSAKRIEELEKEVDALRKAAKTIKKHWQGVLLKREDHWQGIHQERERAGERERERADEGEREREREEAAVMKEERDALRSELAALSGAPPLLSSLSDAALDALKTEQEEALARVNDEVQTRLDKARAREQVADRNEAFRCPICIPPPTPERNPPLPPFPPCLLPAVAIYACVFVYPLEGPRTDKECVVCLACLWLFSRCCYSAFAHARACFRRGWAYVRARGDREVDTASTGEKSGNL